MSVLGIILVIFLVMLLVGGLPQTGYHNYGYGPSGLVFVLVIVVVVLLATGRL